MFGPPLLHPRISWRQRSVAPLCTAKGLFIHCFLVVCSGGRGSLGAKGNSSEVLSLPLPAAAGLGGGLRVAGCLVENFFTFILAAQLLSPGHLWWSLACLFCVSSLEPDCALL